MLFIPNILPSGPVQALQRPQRPLPVHQRHLPRLSMSAERRLACRRVSHQDSITSFQRVDPDDPLCRFTRPRIRYWESRATRIVFSLGCRFRLRGYIGTFDLDVEELVWNWILNIESQDQNNDNAKKVVIVNPLVDQLELLDRYGPRVSRAHLTPYQLYTSPWSPTLKDQEERYHAIIHHPENRITSSVGQTAILQACLQDEEMGEVALEFADGPWANLPVRFQIIDNIHLCLY